MKDNDNQSTSVRQQKNTQFNECLYYQEKQFRQFEWCRI